MRRNVGRTEMSTLFFCSGFMVIDGLILSSRVADIKHGASDPRTARC